MMETGITAVRISSFTSALKHGFKHARQELHTNHIVVTQVPSTTVSNASQQAESPESGWTPDFSRMSFPSHPASGLVHGDDFALRNATIRAANLKLNSANGLSLEVLGLGGPVEGRNIEIQPTNQGANPRIRTTWQEGGVVKTATFNRGFRLKLEFGQANKRNLTGKIYLSLPDEAKSYVAGTFELRLPKPK